MEVTLPRECLKKLLARTDLTEHETEELFTAIMSGEVEPSLLGGILAAWAAKGEAVQEIVGAARVMRKFVTKVNCPGRPIDTCGTGGDGISTFNISTTAAIIAAGAGAIVAKHGNRTNTRVSGSAEALAALGVNIEAELPVIERCLAEAGLAFLYAPRLHPAMKYAAPVRRSLGIRTIFNILGPLTNPAGAKRQVLGLNRPELMHKIAQALQMLGTEHAFVVHGSGLCDLTITGPSLAIEVKPDRITEHRIEPEDFGFKRARLEDLLVDSPQASAEAIEAILEGQKGPRRDVALLNAAAAIVVAGLADDLNEGIRKAAESIDSGAAAQKLQKLKEITNTDN